MRLEWLLKHVPSRERLKENRILKPFARHLHHHFLWQFNRRSVAGGVAVGLFFGLLFPFFQIFAAAIAAILLRVNLPVAAFSTLVTNPLTFPGIYYLAYRIGDALTGDAPVPPEPVVMAEAKQTATQQADPSSWLGGLLDWFNSVGLPLAVGLSVLAVVSAGLGYLLVNVIWKLRANRRWRRRSQR